MVIRADINGTRPVTPVAASRVTTSLGDTGQETLDKLSRTPLGKVLQAQVLSRLNDGSFMVKVSDAAIRMNLPAGTQAGDALELTLVATHPRPAFGLPAAATGSAGHAAETSLSSGARLIGQVLQAAQEQGAPGALVGKAPLVPSPSASPTQVAAALKNTLAASGLFYESHLHQWANGERPLSELMQEPQAKQSSPTLLAAMLRKEAPDTAQAGTKTTDPAGTRTQNTALLSGDPHKAADGEPNVQGRTAPYAAENASQAGKLATAASDTNERQTDFLEDKLSGSDRADTKALANSSARAEIAVPARMQAAMPTASVPQPGADGLLPTTSTPANIEGFSSDSVRMIALQLDTLEHRHVAWQGELWPGQPMEWEVTEESPKGNGGNAEASWQSVVRFELPTLGAVAASIRLTGGRLQVQVRTANEAAIPLLREHGDELASALDAAGSPLDLLTVKRDESV
ncbi:MAG TPA: flagellar hook-length control protein FliK [Noviherbaspirillum sp.]|nr:flagellar hook-length control protein FliK [Noviherbaspirillum sp.]